MFTELTLRVAARFEASTRSEVKELIAPLNKPKGIDREVVRESVRTEIPADGVKPARNDIRPQDVFFSKPKNLNVLNYANKGWPGTDADYGDMEKAINKQIPKDKGFDSVHNLSQYLIDQIDQK